VFCYENNPLVRKALEEPGRGRVLVVDAGGSLRCAVLGDNLAANAQNNGWSVSFWGGGCMDLRHWAEGVD
jgi:regulator of ribonuclease activity A